MFKKKKKDENKTNAFPSSSTTVSSSNPLTIKVPNSQYIKSRNDLVDDFNHKLKPIYYAIQDLATRENVRIERLNSQIDSYLAVETLFREQMCKFHRQWCTTSKWEDDKSFVNNSLIVLQDIQSDIFKMLDQRRSQEKRGVSFGDLSVSVFTTTNEDTPKSPTLTDIPPLDSGVQIVPSQDNFSTKGPQRVDVTKESSKRKKKHKRRLNLRWRSFNWSLNESHKIMTSKWDSLKRSCRSEFQKLSQGLLPESNLTDRSPLLSRRLKLNSGQEQQEAWNETKWESTQRTCEFLCNGKTCFCPQFSTKSYVQQLEDYRKQCSSDKDYENPFE